LRVKFSGQPWDFARERIVPIRKENAFQGNDFRYAELEDCSIAGGINLDANLWPEPAPYVIVRSAHDRIARAMTRLDELPEGGVRNRAAARLQVYAYGCWPLQTDMLLRRDELGPAAALLLYDQAATER
jgi:hypothetical protein